MHWAIHGQTASEIVFQRADSEKQNMGLTTWKNAPMGKIRKTDASIDSIALVQLKMDIILTASKSRPTNS